MFAYNSYVFYGFLGRNFLWMVFIDFPICVGVNKYIINTICNKQNIKDIVMAFKSNYINIVITNLLCYIYVLLWTILFVIPGIVKWCEYSMVPYILAEKPDIKPSDAMKLSREMTMGHKMDIFILYISFIGWFFLGILACGIGAIFVIPYINVTFAELYITLKEDTIKNRMDLYNDFYVQGDQNF